MIILSNRIWRDESEKSNFLDKIDWNAQQKYLSHSLVNNTLLWKVELRHMNIAEFINSTNQSQWILMKNLSIQDFRFQPFNLSPYQVFSKKAFSDLFSCKLIFQPVHLAVLYK